MWQGCSLGSNPPLILALRKKSQSALITIPTETDIDIYGNNIAYRKIILFRLYASLLDIKCVLLFELKQICGSYNPQSC